MIVQTLTTLSLIVNVGYQIPQVILLANQNSSPVPSVSTGKPSKTLSVATILVKTTGNYFAVSYYLTNGVPFLSWCYQLSTILQDIMMMYFWLVLRLFE